jgi:hypothetical protein
MPDRLLRARILRSRFVNRLTWPAEVFYRRLMSVVDDYGRGEAYADVLRADLYPLKLDKVSESDVVKWLDECSKAGLVRLYTVENKEYLEVLQFNQRLRAMTSRYPPPPDNVAQMPDIGGHVSANDGHVPLEEKEKRKEKKKREGGAPAGANHTPEDVEMYNAFKGWIEKYTPRVNDMQQPITIDQYLKLRKKFSKELIQKLLTSMQNRKDLLRKYVSTYLTICNWASREDKGNKGDNEITPGQFV